MRTISLTDHEQEQLESVACSQIDAALARRARVILALAKCETYVSICDRLDCNPHYVSHWKRRFLDGRLDGLLGRHVGQPARTLTPRLEAQIVDATRKPPCDGSEHWSIRRLALHLGISHMMVARVWAKQGLTSTRPAHIKRKRVTLRTTPEQALALKALAAQRGETVGQMLDFFAQTYFSQENASHNSASGD
jgi:transposase-like protein